VSSRIDFDERTERLAVSAGVLLAAQARLFLAASDPNSSDCSASAETAYLLTKARYDAEVDAWLAAAAKRFRIKRDKADDIWGGITARWSLDQCEHWKEWLHRAGVTT